MFGLLAGTFERSRFGRDVVDYTVDSKTASNTGQVIVAVDIAMFADVQAFRQKVDELWEVMKSSPTLPGVAEARLPGERSAQLYSERMAHGVPLAPNCPRLWMNLLIVWAFSTCSRRLHLKLLRGHCL